MPEGKRESVLIHEKQSVTRTARSASSSGSSFSSNQRRKEEKNEIARKSRRMSSWFWRKEGGRGNQERIRRRRRRRRGGGAIYCPRIHSLFQFKLKPQKKRRARTRAHTCRCTCRRALTSELVHRFYVTSLCTISLSLSLSRVIARPRRARECRFYRTVNITNTSSDEGYPCLFFRTRAYRHNASTKKGAFAYVGCRRGLTRCECFSSLCRCSLDLRSNSRTKARF